MNLFLFITILVVSFVVVRIGAIAFQLTGLDWELAKFQALSCFTGTGFTTRESELITSHPQRRRIASILIVLGHAGFVTMIATFANTLRTGTLLPAKKLPVVHSNIPAWLIPWFNLAIIIVALYALYWFFVNSKFAGRITDMLRSEMLKQRLVKPVTISELLMITGGYGVSRIEVCDNSPLIGKTLAESELRKQDITVLVIERGEDTIANPGARTRILKGDRLICFGRLNAIKKNACFT